MAAIDNFTGYQPAVTSPIDNLAEVTPNDGTDLSNTTRAIYVGTAGAVTLTTKGGQTVTFANMAVGWHPVRATRILATGTDATDILAGW